MTTLTLLPRRRGFGRKRDQTFRFGRNVALFFLAVGPLHFITHAESAWLVPGSDAASVSQASGLNAPPVWVEWKDASIDAWRPTEPLGAWSFVQVSPQRDVPASRISALLSFGTPFGTSPGQIPTNAIIANARLWLPVTVVKGHFQIQLRAVPAGDADWQPSEVTADFKRAHQPWSADSVLDPSLPLLGTFDAPTQAGWFEVPVDLGASLDALRHGQFAGWLLTSESAHSPEIRVLQWTSARSTSTTDYPALHLEWHLPELGPDLSPLPGNLFSYTDRGTFLWSTNACRSLAVDGQPLTPSTAGFWTVSLAKGVHEIQVANHQGTSVRRVVVETRSLAIDAIERDATQHVRLTWSGLPDWTYGIEVSGPESDGWNSVSFIEGDAGPMTQSLPSPGVHHRYRLTAIPNPRLYSAP